MDSLLLSHQRSPGASFMFKNIYLGTSMVVQWLRLHLPMQGVWVWSLVEGFPNSSVGKESTCNAGDPGSNPGSGRYAGEGLAYPLQYSWASLVAQLLKNPPAMQETWVRSLGWDPLEKGKATHSNNSGLENSMDCIVDGVAESDTTEQLSLSLNFSES